MPVSTMKPPSIRVEILPLASSSVSSVEEVGLATQALWQVLTPKPKRPDINGSAEDVIKTVAIVFDEDRRLGPHTSKSLVVRIRISKNSSDDLSLSLPAHLIPIWSATPIFATVKLHEPIPLTLAILQPTSSDEGNLSADDLDLSSLLGTSTEHLTNGHAQGRNHAALIREGSSISIPAKSSSLRSTYRVLMLEPVQQGILTSATKVIMSNQPYTPQPELNGYHDTESNHSKTHLSLEDFDPDAFLSSSLSISHDFTEGSPTLEYDMAGSISSETSGSITPRPYVNGNGDRSGSPPAAIDEVFAEERERGGTAFSGIVSSGSSGSEGADEVVWVGMSGLGRAGIFEGDWVLLKSDAEQSGRLVKIKVWERLDEYDDTLPANPLLLSPALHRALSLTGTQSVYMSPTTFGARIPTVPTARAITLSRVATSEGVDKRYERSWIQGLRSYFTTDKAKVNTESHGKLVKRGDIISVPAWKDRPISDHDGGDSDSDDEFDAPVKTPAVVVYFIVTSLSYEPLLSLEEDFSSTVSSKARSGELGCWIDVGDVGSTKMVLAGVERCVVKSRGGDAKWHSIAVAPHPYSMTAATRLKDLLATCFSSSTIAWSMQLSLLIKGARGSGKTSSIKYLANEIGFNVVQVECYDIVGDTATITEGTIKAQLEKAKSCAPSILFLHHIEALAKKSENTSNGRPPTILKVLDDASAYMKDASAEVGWPLVLVGTTSDEEAVPPEILGCFKQDISLSAPNEEERLVIINNLLEQIPISPDVNPKSIATQTAALQPGDIHSLILKATDNSLERALKSSGRTVAEIKAAGLSLIASDINAAIGEARASYSDSIGAPKIPNVSWDDVGGLANVKADILDTISLPLEHPELFADGLKKRSGILLYGPPGTGKTLLAKAVATSLSLNFFSVKGPELLNMYIGESEANVRRVFQRARDAAPCVIFMDELDSVAPKRGNQGDSGGVMDRIVSQLLAELDGMGGGGVYVMAATNRPDLLDPALLRPGRFDRMLYLGVPTTHQDQLNILQALTRKFQLDPKLSLEVIAEQCPFNYTGADLYALCSDAMLKAMTRVANTIDARIATLNDDYEQGKRTGVYPLTPQYYLATMATPEEIVVQVGREDFELSLEGLVASVSEGEMEHYRRVQDEFKGFNIGES